MRIAIQGIEGSYHDIASRKYFGEDIELVCCDTFEELFEQLESGHADKGMMAIENTVAGTLLPNYVHMQESSYNIVGEVYLRIEHQLMGLKGVKIENLKEVRSHYMALRQCGKTLKQYPHIEKVVDKDTALSAKELSISKKAEVGVIASKLAAELFDLEILLPNIEDNKRNFTRFLVLDNQKSNKNSSANKASVCFHLDHNSGSLATVLTLLSGFGVNLTKIQSMPHVGKEWQYNFFLDMEFEEYTKYQLAIDKMKFVTHELTILGEYESGECPQY